MSNTQLDTQLDTTVVRSLIRQAIALHKTSVKQRDLAREVARSLPREAIRLKSEVNATLRGVLSGGEITPERAASIIESLRVAENLLEQWRKENQDLLTQLSTATKNLWVHINAIRALGASLPRLEEEG